MLEIIMLCAQGKGTSGEERGGGGNSRISAIPKGVNYITCKLTRRKWLTQDSLHAVPPTAAVWDQQLAWPEHCTSIGCFGHGGAGPGHRRCHFAAHGAWRPQSGASRPTGTTSIAKLGVGWWANSVSLFDNTTSLPQTSCTWRLWTASLRLLCSSH